MTSGDLLRETLRLRGYDGLSNPEYECGCLLNDLQPCDSIHLLFCHPGYKQPCAGGCGSFIVSIKRDPGPLYCSECGKMVFRV
jgi:hypothetical protein